MVEWKGTFSQSLLQIIQAFLLSLLLVTNIQTAKQGNYLLKVHTKHGELTVPGETAT